MRVGDVGARLLVLGSGPGHQVDLQRRGPEVPVPGPGVHVGHLGGRWELAEAAQGVVAHAPLRRAREEVSGRLRVQPSVQGPGWQQKCCRGEPVAAEMGARQHPIAVGTAPQGVGQASTGMSAAAVPASIGADQQERIGVQLTPQPHGPVRDGGEIPASHISR